MAESTTTTRLPVKLHRHVCLVLTEDAVLAEELLARKKLAQSAGAADESILQGMDKGTLAYALALAGNARHNARPQGADAAKAVDGWEPEWHRS